MRDILSSKRDQVPEFKQALVDSKQDKIVEAVPWDFFWGFSLSKKEVLYTKTKFWFGKNQMGLLLTELETQFRIAKNKIRRHSNRRKPNLCHKVKISEAANQILQTVSNWDVLPIKKQKCILDVNLNDQCVQGGKHKVQYNSDLFLYLLFSV